MSSSEDEVSEGYNDGRDLDAPHPSDNRSEWYKHGFRNGRDDAEVSKRIRKFPSRTAQQARDAYAALIAQEEAE